MLLTRQLLPFPLVLSNFFLLPPLPSSISFFYFFPFPPFSLLSPSSPLPLTFTSFQVPFFLFPPSIFSLKLPYLVPPPSLPSLLFPISVPFLSVMSTLRIVGTYRVRQAKWEFSSTFTRFAVKIVCKVLATRFFQKFLREHFWSTWRQKCTFLKAKGQKADL